MVDSHTVSLILYVYGNRGVYVRVNPRRGGGEKRGEMLLVVKSGHLTIWILSFCMHQTLSWLFRTVQLPFFKTHSFISYLLMLTFNILTY